jgi:hypothetical protein
MPFFKPRFLHSGGDCIAKLNVKLPDEFLRRISRLGERTDEIVPRVLQAGAEVVLEKVKSNLQAAIGKNTKGESRSTGELASALGVSRDAWASSA